MGDFIALIAGFSHMLGLDDITPPDAMMPSATLVESIDSFNNFFMIGSL